MNPKNTRKFLTGKNTFKITLLVIGLTVLSIWLLGLGQHRSLFANTLLSISILSVAFFLFLLVGLYNGVKLKDDLGKITDKIKLTPEKMDLSGDWDLPTDIGYDGENPFFGFILWIVVTLCILLFIWIFAPLFWATTLVFVAMLYWIFFRALRLVFKNSNKCKGDLMSSFFYGIAYTILYCSWIYIVVLVSHYLV